MPRHKTSKSRSKKSKAKLPFLANKKLLGVVFVLLFAGVGVYLLFRSFAAVAPPPAGGYTSLKPVGSFASLPSDAQAASMVRRSAWEPRPDNYTANHTVPPSTFKTAGYAGMVNHAVVFGRVTGNFTGTTDEIIQWAAFKWGLPDDVIRAQAVAESNWFQNKKDASGRPISGQGYGDFGHCSGIGSPPPSGYGTTGPSSFGLLQAKWCALKDANASGYDGWPWSETSTAYAIDLYAAVMRGCYEGWDTWLGNGYTAGNLWGCIGRWYSGQWLTSSAQTYMNTVQNYFNTKPWRSWPDYSSSLPSPDPTPPPPTADSSAPVVTINSPVNNTTVTRTTNITATSVDNVLVTRMEIYIGGISKASSSSGSIQYSWSSRRASSGLHTITIRANDAAGNIGTKSVTVYK